MYLATPAEKMEEKKVKEMKDAHKMKEEKIHYSSHVMLSTLKTMLSMNQWMMMMMNCCCCCSMLSLLLLLSAAVPHFCRFCAATAFRKLHNSLGMHGARNFGGKNSRKIVPTSGTQYFDLGIYISSHPTHPLLRPFHNKHLSKESAEKFAGGEEGALLDNASHCHDDCIGIAWGRRRRMSRF